MKFYGIDMQGHLRLREYADTIPAYDSTGARGIIYVNDSNNSLDKIYIGGKQAGAWVELQTVSGLSTYYTIAQANDKFLATVDPNILDVGTWFDKIVFDADQPGAFAVPGGTTLVNIAETATIYNNTIGALMGVKRNGDGDIYANIGHLTATAAQYADLAEIYTCDETTPVGTVMEVSDGSDYEVVPAMFALSISVVGVVSESPAYLMNSGSQGLPIALTGKVPVRVVGEVTKGDFIVPAGDGCARKGEIDEVAFKIGVSFESNNNKQEKLAICVIK